VLAAAGGAAVLGSLFGGIVLLTHPARAAAGAPCPPGTAGTLTNISRAIVPVGITVIRGFNILGDQVNATNVQLTVPPEYSPQQIPGRKAFVLQLKAPHGGPFAVHATWTQQYVDDGGTTQTCSTSADSTLNAAKGRPLVIRPPAGKTQYDNPIIWGWKCNPDSDPIPQLLTIRWEVDQRELPLFAKGGNPPFTLSRRAKTVKVRNADPCDGHQVTGLTKKRLAKNATLSVILGGNATTGVGGLLVKFGGEFRIRHGSQNNIHPLHLSIVLKQGPRTLINSKVCAWQQTGFEIANHRGVTCWRR
jgi:hypothetical protein